MGCLRCPTNLDFRSRYHRTQSLYRCLQGSSVHERNQGFRRCCFPVGFQGRSCCRGTHARYPIQHSRLYPTRRCYPSRWWSDHPYRSTSLLRRSVARQAHFPGTHVLGRDCRSRVRPGWYLRESPLVTCLLYLPLVRPQRPTRSGHLCRAATRYPNVHHEG
jgi:hypothetical protein